MNLISEPWIPIRRLDGSVEKIAPWQLTAGIADNPAIAVSSPRPDFDGALTQFLIGLLQTTCAPDETRWWAWNEEPPAPETLKERFESIAHAFELEGQTAFMQDFNPEQLDKQFGISALLIGAPPEDSDTDLFIKQDAVTQLCRHCASVAIFALQTWAPEGGRGYRTGLRGGGPITTLVLGHRLWDTCWLNVLERSRYAAEEVFTASSEADRFPWLAPTRTSEADPPAGVTTPADVHPDQQYWTLPRRIRLLASEGQGACDICGQTDRVLFKRFLTKNYGVNYVGFEHPLGPHYVKDRTLLPAHPQPGGIGYRYWLGVVENSADGTRTPARVVDQYRTLVGEDADLWAFGFDMKSNKARCWYDATMPILTAPLGMETAFRDSVTRLVKGAEKTAGYLRSFLKTAMAGKATVRGDLSFVQSDFWEFTEAPFFSHLRRIRAALRIGPEVIPLLESWLSVMHAAALELFDRHSRTGDFDAVSPRRIALARNGLGKALCGSLLREKILGLPKPMRAKK